LFVAALILQNDLAKLDRAKTPWLIGVLHAPWYNSNDAHQGEGDDMLHAMEDILFQAKVDIIFAGHVHAYERSVSLILFQVWSGHKEDKDFGLARRRKDDEFTS
jgi:hypothetical protein